MFRVLQGGVHCQDLGLNLHPLQCLIVDCLAVPSGMLDISLNKSLDNFIWCLVSLQPWTLCSFHEQHDLNHVSAFHVFQIMVLLAYLQLALSLLPLCWFLPALSTTGPWLTHLLVGWSWRPQRGTNMQQNPFTPSGALVLRTHASVDLLGGSVFTFPADYLWTCLLLQSLASEPDPRPWH